MTTITITEVSVHILPKIPENKQATSRGYTAKKNLVCRKIAIPMKLFPRSPISTLDPSTMVMLPTPPRTRFFNASEPVGPQLSKQMLASSRAACPSSPQILRFSQSTPSDSQNPRLLQYLLPKRNRTNNTERSRVRGGKRVCT